MLLDELLIKIGVDVASQKNCEKKPLKLRKPNPKIFSLF